MTSSIRRIPPDRLHLVTTGIRVLWTALRLPAAAVLLALEPLVSLVLISLFVLGTVAALVLQLSRDLPSMPFWSLVTLSIGSLLTLTAYHMLIRMLWR